MNHRKRLYLASQSPRRGQLLEQIAIAFERLSVAVDETPAPGEPPLDYVQRLAIAKADAGWQQLVTQRKAPLPVLGADTIVVLAGQILTKPGDRAEGLAMLESLSGRSHRVITGLCLRLGERQLTAVNSSEVRFRAISPREISAYWDSGEPRDKAGGYGIQGLAATFVEHISGSYSSIVGLPLLETQQLLEQIESHE